MKNKIIFLIPFLGGILLTIGCSRYCDLHMPVDMASYLPSMDGKTFVYVNDAGDSLTIVGSTFFIQPDEDIGMCEKCSCGVPYMEQKFYNQKNNHIWEIILLKGFEQEFILYLYRDFFKELYAPKLHATFDSDEHFVTRDFGDTLVLTNPSNPDTAVWVRGVGLTRINDYRLVATQ